jgi:Predicted 3'-5' exonuclease related to the exonuclease domain of PolB
MVQERVDALVVKPDPFFVGRHERIAALAAERSRSITSEGRIREIADYCESDVVNTHRVWLRYGLFRGCLSDAAFQASEANLIDFIKARGNTKPHLADLT